MHVISIGTQRAETFIIFNQLLELARRAAHDNFEGHGSSLASLYYFMYEKLYRYITWKTYFSKTRFAGDNMAYCCQIVSTHSSFQTLPSH